MRCRASRTWFRCSAPGRVRAASSAGPSGAAVGSLSVNLVDLSVIALLLVSGLLALMRGLVREVLSIAGLVGAFFAAVYAFPHAQPYVAGWLPYGRLVANVVTAVAIFVPVLVVLSIVSHRLAARVKDSALGALDRTLGFVFGLVRGAALVSFAYLLMVMVVSPEARPAWITEARVAPLAAYGAEILRELVPGLNRGSNSVTEGRSTRDTDAARASALAHPPARREGASEPGYAPEDRAVMERLVKDAQQ
ncbi:MAG: CvpA family protein [Alphaproteobacteria bacterium]|nr:CvpA family protein [Alphaproteobacteria bacterium]